MTNIPKIFIFIGRSGCGKGTQADLLMTYLSELSGQAGKTLHVETGALLRKHVQGDSYTQKLCRQAMDEGKLMPEAVMVSLWERHLQENFNGTENILFDGCPRKLPEAQLLNSALEFYELKEMYVVYMDVSEDWSGARLAGRGRKDDTPEAIKKRLAWFETDVVPTINYYRSNPDYKFLTINGEQTIPEVHKEILAKLGLNL